MEFENVEFVPTTRIDTPSLNEPVNTNEVIHGYSSMEFKSPEFNTTVPLPEVKPIQTLKENGYSSAIGDPYITPYHGNLYKIPDTETIYRFYQNDNIIINGQVEKINMKKINPKVRFINSNRFNLKLKNIEFEYMYFITKVCIFEITDNDHSAHLFDIENEEFLSDKGNIDILSKSTKILTLNEMYPNEKASVTHIKLNNLEIEFYKCNNPQIYTGIKLVKCDSDATGILMNECDSSSCILDTIYDTSYVHVKCPKSEQCITEKFHSSNGNSKNINIKIL